MNQRYFLSFVICLSLGCAGSLPAQTIVVDQQLIETLPGAQTDGTLAQTFTVGVGGELNSVELLLRSAGNRVFDIRPTDATGRPSADDNSVLFSTVLAGSSDQPFTYLVDVSSAQVQVDPGDLLAIVLSPADDSTGIVRWASSRSNDNPYAGGQGFSRNQYTGEFSTFFDSDYGFTTTVATNPITPGCLLGDIDLSGTVDFLDIAPFIAVLFDGTSQCEADCDESGFVNFSDLAPFIVILSSPKDG